MPHTALTHLIGFDDAPFECSHRGDVTIVGAVYSGPRLEGVLSSKVRRDGRNSTEVLLRLIRGSRFYPQLQAVLLQGIAMAGFNVVDIHRLQRELDRPVLVIARRPPALEKICAALLDHVPGGRQKWRLIEQAGPMEAIGGLYVQRAGLTAAEAERLIAAAALHSRLPEPLRTAHLIAGGLVSGESRHRA